VIRFVNGFLFSPGLEYVALIKKTHGPLGTIGKWNGIGGKVEPGESAHEAMAREFLEEAGVGFASGSWRHYASVSDGDSQWHCDFFELRSKWIENIRTLTDEEVRIHSMSELPRDLSNFTRWALPLAADPLIRDVVNIAYT
jgi:8-oxo-dGTP diphosphatase